MDHVAGVILWWALGVPAVAVLTWLTYGLLRSLRRKASARDDRGGGGGD